MPGEHVYARARCPLHAASLSALVGGMAPAAGPAAAGVAPKVRAIEVVQAIQSTDNSVRLIAGKSTVVRAYIDPASVPHKGVLTGELEWRNGPGGMQYLPAMNRIEVGAAIRPTLQEQRHDVTRSLNFRLPAKALVEGQLELVLHRLIIPGGADLRPAPSEPVKVKFVASPTLRVRAIGLRYKSPVDGSPVYPDSLHFEYFRSFLQRAYPVARIEWSQLMVDADLLKPPFEGLAASDMANAQLAALRAREISSGRDPRTHYYGLVDDNMGHNFMRGSALYDSATKVFGLVASGPVGVPKGWTGDSDASYADWYGAHELGHTFQRRHPGFPLNEQPRDPEETTFPYPHGLITLANGNFVGFDVGDSDRGLPMMALPGNEHHDVMTYADRQWVSAYTYEAIHDRLLDEEVRLAP